MDGDRFDNLSRRLANAGERGITRRAALRGVASGLLAGIAAGRRGAGAQVTQAQCGNSHCKDNPAICASGCVCCDYGNSNSRCRPPGTCTPGTVLCPPGQVLGPSGVCAAPTTTTTTTAAPCPSGYEAINGACFRITGPGYPGCGGGGCVGAGSIVQSGNFLCIRYTGTNCDANSSCGPGLVCQYGGTSGSCAGAC